MENCVCSFDYYNNVQIKEKKRLDYSKDKNNLNVY